jgi:hypothetical protein
MITTIKTIRNNTITFKSETLDTGYIMRTPSKPEGFFVEKDNKLNETKHHLLLRKQYVTKEGGTLIEDKSTVINDKPVIFKPKNPIK